MTFRPRSLWTLLRRFLRRLPPAQATLLGFALYTLAGWALLCLPWLEEHPSSALDHLFMAVSAVSTTGLITISTPDSYNFAGELVILALIQLGGIGYMTVSSFVILARKRPLSPVKLSVLRQQFALPENFNLKYFARQLVFYTLAVEALGAAALYAEFSAAGVPDALWSAVFHSVSAFCTAGFSLNNNSLEGFADNTVVCVTIGALAYTGALGFIVLQDCWLRLRVRQHRITFTSKVIVTMTALVFAAVTPLLFVLDSSLAALPWPQRLLAAAFQAANGSTTAGFNSVPIGALAPASLVLMTAVMIIGASPSGTGGGVKTTTVSALLGASASALRGLGSPRLLGREIPPSRLNTAIANATLYVTTLTLGLFLLMLVEKAPLGELSFEAASALGTVGLSMGVTPSLGNAGKLVIIGLMFVGRVGPLTSGLAFVRRRTRAETTRTLPGDLTV